MATIAIYSFPGTGHLNPMLALGRRLQRNGHNIIVISPQASRSLVSAAGLEWLPTSPAWHSAVGSHGTGRNDGRHRALFTMLAQSFDILKYGLDLLRSRKVDVVVSDQSTVAAESLAEAAGVHYASVGLHPPFLRDPSVPATYFSWRYDDSSSGIERNERGYRLIERATTALLSLLNEFRSSVGLIAYKSIFDLFTRSPVICQLPAELDLPLRFHPSQLSYVGPLIDREARRTVPFPFDRLDGRPLVYASLGTVNVHNVQLYEAIASGCASLKIQLILSLGGGPLLPCNTNHFEAAPVVLHYVPQLDLISHAAAVITHAGANTTLEALSVGVPLLAVPLCDDQPGMAVRIERARVGLVRDAFDSWEHQLNEVLGNPMYKANAAKMRHIISSCGGVEEASRIIEAIL